MTVPEWRDLPDRDGYWEHRDLEGNRELATVFWSFARNLQASFDGDSHPKYVFMFPGSWRYLGATTGQMRAAMSAIYSVEGVPA